MAMTGPATAPIARDTVNSLIADIWNEVSRVEKHGVNLSNLADAVHGPRPSPVGDPAKDVPAQSVIDNLSKLKRSLQAAIGHCEDMAQSIDAALR